MQGVVYANREADYRREGLSLGVGWWKSNRLELQFSASVSAAQRDSAGSSTLITGLGTFGVVVGAPRRDRAKVVAPLADPVPGA
jgi:hypothetical protein